MSARAFDLNKSDDENQRNSLPLTDARIRNRVQLKADFALASETAGHVEAVLVGVAGRPISKALVNVCWGRATSKTKLAGLLEQFHHRNLPTHLSNNALKPGAHDRRLRDVSSGFVTFADTQL